MDELNIADLDSSTFSKVEGFAVRLLQRPGLPGHGLRFVDGDGEVVAGFAWWDDVEVTLRGWTLADVPLGTLEEPFSEFEQCWILLVWRDGEDVLIAEELEDEFNPTFPRRFRVPVSDYFDAWNAALTEAQSL